MKSVLSLAFALIIAVTASLSMADEVTSHDTHHPDTAASKSATQKKSTVPMENLDAQIKTMRDMREKMLSAKTPGERNALMSEHLKTMQEGMSMMSGMMGSNARDTKPMSPQMMQKQMGMMQVMMQMMMDQMEMQKMPAK